MEELLTAAQMREIERRAIASGAVTGLELMERAGMGTVQAILKKWPELIDGDRTAFVFCGPGNNGGDGFVIARLLADRGWQVEVFAYGAPDAMPPDARANHDLWCEIGMVHPLAEADFDSAMAPFDIDLLVDALFGTGLTRALDGPEAALWPLYDHLRFDDAAPYKKAKRYRTVAVDLPSGICSDSGRVLMVPGARATSGMHTLADLSVTFHCRKLGHVLPDEAATQYGGVHLSGETRVVDIGLETPDDMRQGPDLVHRAQLRPGLLSKPASHRPCPHKFAYGHALVLAGGAGRGGAARLAARGALRVGAGLVTVGCPPSSLQENAIALDAVMVRRCDGPDGLINLLDDDRINALCLGPGLGATQATRDLVTTSLRVANNRAAEVSVVLDADGLSAFAGQASELLSLLGPTNVITPHGGEFARIFPDLAEQLAAPAVKGPAFSKVDAARAAAARANCVVVLKGPDTIVASPDGRTCVHAAFGAEAAPWLATAGTGDVLAGFIAGLLARGVPAAIAAETAVCLHAECARAFGPGLIAEDLPDMVPQVLARLGL